MLASKEDAEDVLQEVFAAAFNAILADEREINVRPWLYRIARNRSLNHLRRAQAVGVDSMDVHFSEHGLTTADKVHRREEFRLLVADVQDLPETQKTALLLREIDALSYEQIAEAMETTVPSVKSLLVRARVSLAEAAEARLLTCEEVRERARPHRRGPGGTTAPLRRHLRTCERVPGLPQAPARDQQGARRALPGRRRCCCSRRRSSPTSARAPPRAAATAAAGGRRGRRRRSGGCRPGIGTLATKAVAGLAAAAIVTAGAVEVQHVTRKPKAKAEVAVAAAAPAAAAPPAVAAAAPAAEPAREARPRGAPHRSSASSAEPKAKPTPPRPSKPEATPVAGRRREEPALTGEHASADDRRSRRGATGTHRRRRSGAIAPRSSRRGPYAPPVTAQPSPTPQPAGADARADAGADPGARAQPEPAPEPAAGTRAPPAPAVAGAPMIEFDDFLKVDMRVGRVLAVEDFPEARKPAWKLTIDFGDEIGTKRSSAQITNYAREELEGRLVVAVVNFPPRQIGPFMLRGPVPRRLRRGGPDHPARARRRRPARRPHPLGRPYAYGPGSTPVTSSAWPASPKSIG